MLQLFHPTSHLNGKIQITGSKSESNRWLILQQIFPELKEIINLSNSEDTNKLKEALIRFNSRTRPQETPQEIDIGHAGTAMRFLTAYFAVQPDCDIILTGSERMQQRPIEPLVTALNSMGCDISYIKNQGFPPLRIRGREIEQKEVRIQADISSQYITALLLIASRLPQGLIIYFDGELTSRPYIEMTIHQLLSIDIQVKSFEKGIQIFPKKSISQHRVVVESDWSSASYWFSMMALSNAGEIELSSFSKSSLQGDALIQDIYTKYFGVHSEIIDDTLRLKKVSNFKTPEYITLNLNHTPDIAQTIAVTCASLKVKAILTGLHTLKLKETDRLQALQNELKKVGVQADITEDCIELKAFKEIKNTPEISTYQDHRMAMAFAPMALKIKMRIQDETVVEKSYPTFWKDLNKLGFEID